MTWTEEQELEVAQVVERLVEDLSTPLGRRRRRDESHNDGLSVDFTYDERRIGTPAALEVTTLRDQRLTEAFAALPALEDRLNAIVLEENLGGWIAHVHGDARLRDVEQVLLRLVRAGTAIRPGDYTSADLMAADDPQGLTAQHEQLRAEGVVALDRWSAPGFRLALGSHGRGIDGFRDLLEAEIHANEGKLAKCRPRETHLAIDVFRFDASTTPSETSPPALPEPVDHLWVLFRWEGAVEQRQVWHLQRGEAVWELLPDPRFT